MFCYILNYCSNVAEALVSKGLATVIRYKQDDDQRSSRYDDLMAADAKASKSNKGIHEKKDPPTHRVADLAGVSSRFSTLSRQLDDLICLYLNRILPNRRRFSLSCKEQVGPKLWSNLSLLDLVSGSTFRAKLASLLSSLPASRARAVAARIRRAELLRESLSVKKRSFSPKSTVCSARLKLKWRAWTREATSSDGSTSTIRITRSVLSRKVWPAFISLLNVLSTIAPCKWARRTPRLAKRKSGPTGPEKRKLRPLTRRRWSLNGRPTIKLWSSLKSLRSSTSLHKRSTKDRLWNS